MTVEWVIGLAGLIVVPLVAWKVLPLLPKRALRIMRKVSRYAFWPLMGVVMAYYLVWDAPASRLAWFLLGWLACMGFGGVVDWVAERGREDDRPPPAASGPPKPFG